MKKTEQERQLELPGMPKRTNSDDSDAPIVERRVLLLIGRLVTANCFAALLAQWQDKDAQSDWGTHEMAEAMLSASLGMETLIQSTYDQQKILTRSSEESSKISQSCLNTHYAVLEAFAAFVETLPDSP